MELKLERDNEILYGVSQDTLNQISPIEAFTKTAEDEKALITLFKEESNALIGEEIMASQQKLEAKLSILNVGKEENHDYSVQDDINQFYSNTRYKQTRNISILSLDGGGIRGGPPSL